MRAFGRTRAALRLRGRKSIRRSFALRSLGAALAATVFAGGGGWPASLNDPAHAESAGQRAYFQVRPAHSSKCLDVREGSASDGAAIQQYDCIGGNQNQHWDVVPVDGRFQLVARHSGKCLDITGASSNEGALAQQYRCLGGGQANQLWHLDAVEGGAGKFLLKPSHSGHCLDVVGGPGAVQNGALVQQYRCLSGNQNQRWYLEPVDLGGRPLVGMQYWTWFEYEHGDDGPPNHYSGCMGDGWRGAGGRGPFGFAPGSVASLVFNPDPGGVCYSSLNSSTARRHATFFAELGVDFVIIDETNLSKAVPPGSNGIFQGGLAALAGLEEATERRIRGAFMLSVTCWAQACHGYPAGHPNAQTEVFTANSNVRAHIDAIAEQYVARPWRFQHLNGKPLLLFYVNEGSNVHRLPSGYRPPGSPTGANYPPITEQAFHGPGAITPTRDDFDHTVIASGVPKSVHDFFTVRYAVVANSIFDYRPYGGNIWPFTCGYADCKFQEAGYASLFNSRLPGGQRRSLGHFGRMWENARARSVVVVRGWNEFSSTDEFQGSAYTIEPNTRLHQVDTTPGNQDPWYFYNGIKAIMQRGGTQQAPGAHGGECSQWPPEIWARHCLI